MSAWSLQRFPDARSLAAAAAQAWRQWQALSAPGTPRHVALSGGRIAREFFAALAAHNAREPMDWSGIHFFWADERCVPAEDPESNYGVARQLLLEPLGIDPRLVHRIEGERAPAEAARRASAALTATVPADASGTPVLDLVLLGMGEDGHVASLFPGDPGKGTEWYRAVEAPKPPPHRVTMEWRPILAARQAWVLVSGRGKEGALGASLAPAGATPLARVLQGRAETRIFSDLA